MTLKCKLLAETSEDAASSALLLQAQVWDIFIFIATFSFVD